MRHIDNTELQVVQLPTTQPNQGQLEAKADAAAGRMPVMHEHVFTLGSRGGLIANFQAG